MEESNGSLKGPKAMANGVNGHMNGIKPHINGHAVVPRRRTTPRRPGFVARGFSIVARLLTWYSILTLLFRCPSSLEACDNTSPRICKPYFQLRQSVAPHLEPYYDAYAAQYVELARPYYESLDRTVLTPGWSYAEKYGTPQISKAQAYGKAQWQKSIQPQLTKYRALAKAQYDQTLAPRVNALEAAVGPYYDIARTNALQTYHELLLPSYDYLQPFALKGYNAASAFTTDAAIPSAVWVWNKTYFVLDGIVWPQLRILYVENVEPQLVKIGQRLGRYNGKQQAQRPTAEAVTSSVGKLASSFTKPSSSVSSTATSASFAYTSVVTTSEISHTQTPEQPQSTVEAARLKNDQVQAPEWEQGEQEDEVRRIARETVAADLKDWQERYAKAADEGAAEIENRVDEISKHMIRRNARTTGKSTLAELKATVVSELVTLRRDILNIVGAVSKGSADSGLAQEQISTVVRRAGMAIKAKAQEVRTWRENYEAELHGAVTTAAENHFKILDSIRDLAIQKIGMKWAWMDGITYRDWQKYHLLKNRFDEWQGDLEKLIVTHPGLEAAQLEGATLEDEAMNTAQSAAKELARLKQVANWKLIAVDTTDEFDSDITRQAAQAAENAKAAVESGSDEGKQSAQEIVEIATAAAAEPDLPSEASTATEPDLPSEASTATEPDLPSEALTATEADLPSEASTIILAETPIILGNTTELKEEGHSTVEVPLEGADMQEPIIFDEAAHESLLSTTTSSVKPAMFGAAAQAVPSRGPIIDDDNSDGVGGVMDSFYNELPSSISSMAESAYSAAASRANERYSEALSAVSVQVHGTPKPVHEQMLASVTSAYSNAMASASSRLDDAIRAASEQFGATPTKKSFLPTTVPLPTVPSVDWAHIESIASERLAQGKAWAEDQYESAKVRVGLAAPTPSTPSEHVEKLLENARHNYYAGLGVAYARYSEFLAAASSAVSSMTATPTPTDFAGTVSSLASVASESAASAAAAAGENVSSAASAASASAASVASVASASAASAASVVNASAGSAGSVVGENVSSVAAAGYNAASAGYDNVASAAGAAGDSIAENWDYLVSQLSVQVYGAPTPTPWYESIYNVLGDYAASVTEGAASATSTAGAYVTAASDQAADQYYVVSSIISELVIGKEPSFTESVFSRLGAAYKTGAASASSLASAAQDAAAERLSGASEVVQSAGEKVASAASEATEAVKESVQHVRDEL